jgi:Cof subfamily protein (haloacid dehalogenase superfamily)
MTRVALVISDVDGTLVTRDKILTESARNAVRRLHAAGIGFTITSSRPPIGMRFLIESLAITLPVGAFNGSSIVDSKLLPLEQHLIPSVAAERSVELLNRFGIDVWLFTPDKWLTRNGEGEYVAHEKRTIRADPTIVTDFEPYLSNACKIVGSSSDAALLQRCEGMMKEAVGSLATAVRSQSYYLDVTPPGCDKGTFVQAITRRLDISVNAVATIGDMQNDLAMFEKSGLSIAMGNATEDVKKLANYVTTSNEEDGFAGAVEIILRENTNA